MCIREIEQVELLNPTTLSLLFAATIYAARRGDYSEVRDMGPVQKGAYSRGAVIKVCGEGELEQFFIKQPNDQLPLERATKDLLNGQRQMPYLRQTLFVNEGPNPYAVIEALPSDSIKLLSILQNFGLQTIQTPRNGEQIQIKDQELENIYEILIQALVDVHSSAIVTTDLNKDQAYIQGLDHLIRGEQRLAGVIQYYLEKMKTDNSALSFKEFEMLIGKMQALKEILAPQSNRIKPVHGDFWAANIFLSLQLDTLYLIDPDIQYSDPALDVCFCLSDLAFISNRLRSLADELVDSYMKQTNDSELRKFLGFFFGYKACVSALFDVSSERDRLERFCAGLGAVESGINKEEFRFAKIDQYAELGQQLLY